jgi:molybdopterin converting factor small subunit
MKVRIKLIATYQKLLPQGTPGNVIELDVPAGIIVSEILARFDVPLDDSSVIVVNGLTVPLETELVENDTVTAFSAIAGG